MSGGALEQAHRLDGPVGGHAEPPYVSAVAAKGRCERLRGDRARAAGGDLEAHRGAGGFSVLVDGLDVHLGGPVARVDESKAARVPGARAGDEHRDAVPRPGERDPVVHAREEAIVALDVRKDLELESRAKAKPPVPGAGAEAFGESHLLVAVLEVFGGEVHGLVGADVEGEGGGRGAFVVEGFDVHRARLAGVVDDADEPLDAVSQPARRGGKERDIVHEEAAVEHGARGRGGQVDEVPGGARDEAHHLERPGRGHREPPPALTRAERAGEPRCPGLELVRAQHAGGTCRKLEKYRARGRRAGVVDGLDENLGRLRPGVDEPQPARLRDVAPGVEQGHPVPGRSRRDAVVHGGEESVGGADVREHVDIEPGDELEPPVAFAFAGRAFEADGRVPPFEIRGAELHDLARADLESEGAPVRARVVDCVDAHLAGKVVVVDDAYHALMPAFGPTLRRGEEGDAIRSRDRSPVRGQGGRQHRRRLRRARGRRGEGNGVRGRGVRRRRVHRARHPRVRACTLELEALRFEHARRPRGLARPVARLGAHPVLGANVRGRRGHDGRHEDRSRQDPPATT